MSRRGGYIGHLTRRFFETLSSRTPDPKEEAWACSYLGQGERELWARMRAADRRHAVEVARYTERLLSDGGHGGAHGGGGAGAEAGQGAPRPVMAAALLHDVGKVSDDLGAPARAFATVIGRGLGMRRARSLAGQRGPLGKIGRYLDHPAVGARLLEAAGSEPITVWWAADHHRTADRWRVPRRYAEALKQADDD